MNEKQLNEGVKEIVMAVLTMAANSYSVNYIYNQLKDRPEPIEQKVKALEIVDDEVGGNEFDKISNQLQSYYDTKKSTESNDQTTKRKAILVKPKIKRETVPQKTDSKNNKIDEDLSYRLINFLKKMESFHPKPYWDYKQYSIGYGTKALPEDKYISETEASNRLTSELKKHKKQIIEKMKKWGYDWNNNQIDALTSFHYNIGNINELTQNGTRDNNTISKMILKYDKAGGKTLPGLTERRKMEHNLFISK